MIAFHKLQKQSPNQSIGGKILARWYQINSTETVPRTKSCEEKEMFITHHAVQLSRSTSIYLLPHTTGAYKAASYTLDSSITENLPDLLKCTLILLKLKQSHSDGMQHRRSISAYQWKSLSLGTVFLRILFLSSPSKIVLHPERRCRSRLKVEDGS